MLKKLGLIDYKFIFTEVNEDRTPISRRRESNSKKFQLISSLWARNANGNPFNRN